MQKLQKSLKGGERSGPISQIIIPYIGLQSIGINDAKGGRNLVVQSGRGKKVQRMGSKYTTTNGVIYERVDPGASK